MIVTATEARQILEGRKTQHRVPVVDPEPFRRRARGSRTPYGPEQTTRPFTPTLDLLVPIRRPETADDGRQTTVVACHIKIVACVWHTDALADLDDRAVRASGHKTLDAYRAHWLGVHDRDWTTRHVKPFQDALAAHGASSPWTVQAQRQFDEKAAERWQTRWADRPAWGFSFTVDQAQDVRSLAPVGRGDDRGYTTATGLDGEGEAVDDTWLNRFAQGSRIVHDDAARAELAAASHALLKARDHARRCGVDVDAEVHGIEKRRDKILAKLDQRPAA